MSLNTEDAPVKPWARVFILISSIIILADISKYLTGSFIPQSPGQALIFQNALLLIVLGSALIEAKFTKPADSVVNSLMGLITLFGVYGHTPVLAWWIVFSYCSIAFVFSATCVANSASPNLTGWRKKLSDFTFRPSVFLGGARRLFSIVFLFAVFSFYEMGSQQTAVLLLFWGIFIVIWPLGIPELLSLIQFKSFQISPIGKVIRTDWPNLVRCALDSNVGWSIQKPKIYQESSSTQRVLLPLYSQIKEGTILGTALAVPNNNQTISNLLPGNVYEDANAEPLTQVQLSQLLGGSATSKLVGFIIEDSEIGHVRFETWDPSSCSEGMLVWVPIDDKQVFYQVTNGRTNEESFESERHGFQVAEASQLGTIDTTLGFRKYNWIPSMNSPVFTESQNYGEQNTPPATPMFSYGTVPMSKLAVLGDFVGTYDHHTAILGVTGSGKTELAYDMLRHAVANHIKVICIDLTARYEGRLVDLTPCNLSISADLATQLGNKLFDVETGEFGAPKEKKVLATFSKQLRTQIITSIETFLASNDDANRVGIIRLEEISNTKATLYITELYLTCLLKYAKDHPTDCPKVLVVVEEAHTVMPEPSTMGLGDFDSKGLVSKIAQIALQGRKYKVGLLVIAQRTATVSKSVLTQCNTIISFTCFDDTSLAFLRNIFGPAHVSLISNLPKLHAVAYGKGIMSERPIEFAIPYDAGKAAAGA